MWKDLLAVFNYFKLRCHHCTLLRNLTAGFGNIIVIVNCVKNGLVSLKSQCVDKLGHLLDAKPN
jgi:hypothetical protein